MPALRTLRIRYRPNHHPSADNDTLEDVIATAKLVLRSSKYAGMKTLWMEYVTNGLRDDLVVKTDMFVVGDGAPESWISVRN